MYPEDETDQPAAPAAPAGPPSYADPVALRMVADISKRHYDQLRQSQVDTEGAFQKQAEMEKWAKIAGVAQAALGVMGNAVGGQPLTPRIAEQRREDVTKAPLETYKTLHQASMQPVELAKARAALLESELTRAKGVQDLAKGAGEAEEKARLRNVGSPPSVAGRANLQAAGTPGISENLTAEDIANLVPAFAQGTKQRTEVGVGNLGVGPTGQILTPREKQEQVAQQNANTEQMKAIMLRGVPVELDKVSGAKGIWDQVTRTMYSAPNSLTGDTGGRVLMQLPKGASPGAGAPSAPDQGAPPGPQGAATPAPPSAPNAPPGGARAAEFAKAGIPAWANGPMSKNIPVENFRLFENHLLKEYAGPDEVKDYRTAQLIDRAAGYAQGLISQYGVKFPDAYGPGSSVADMLAAAPGGSGAAGAGAVGGAIGGGPAGAVAGAAGGTIASNLAGVVGPEQASHRTEEETRMRAAVAAAIVGYRHAMAGANFTRIEATKLAQLLPDENDTVQNVAIKLAEVRRLMQEDMNTTRVGVLGPLYGSVRPTLTDKDLDPTGAAAAVKNVPVVSTAERLVEKPLKKAIGNSLDGGLKEVTSATDKLMNRSPLESPNYQSRPPSAEVQAGISRIRQMAPNFDDPKLQPYSKFLQDALAKGNDNFNAWIYARSQWDPEFQKALQELNGTSP